MKTDTLLYRLFQERPETLFELTGLPQVSSAYRLRAIEVKQTAFRVDGVLLPPDAEEEAPVLFVENQFQPDDEFYPRWLASIFLLLYREQITRPWFAVAVFPDRSIGPPLAPAFLALEPAGLLHRVYLDDLLKLADPTRASFGVRLLRLLVLDAPALAAEARALVEQARTQAEPFPMLDLIETILVYKLPHLTREEIIAMLHLPETDLKQTRFYQDVFAEGEQEGLEKGLEKGLERGLEQARRETAANLLSLTQMDDATIATITGLDQTEVATLRQTPQ